MTSSSSKKEDSVCLQRNMSMSSLFLLSMITATANQLLYKMTLNAFSSKTSNYGFFVSQFNVMFYMIPAASVSLYRGFQVSNSFSKFRKSNQLIFIWMGLFDAASSMLGTMSGAFCPGGLQTILNQGIIPMTMIMAFFFLGTSFRPFQIWGSLFILVGAVIASSDFFTGASVTADSATVSTSAILIYIISVAFSGVSNVYKDVKMKEDDLDEVHTSTVVSFWQLWIGFLFLPILAVPSLGNLTLRDMSYQLSDGYSCFLGKNPSADDDCSNAAVLFISYSCVNFFYNLLLLAITKRGSAVFLVISQALSLPITNIAFTIPAVMGADAEPLSLSDLCGLVLVALGFLAYSGFGFAEGFMVAQGPSGQMTYAHVETQDVLIVPKAVTSDHEKLASFLIDIAVKDIRRERTIEKQRKMMDSSPILASDNDDDGFESREDLTSLDSESNDQELATKQALEISRKLVNFLREKISRHDPEELSIRTEDWNSKALESLISPPAELYGTKFNPKNSKKLPSTSKHHYELINSSGWSFYGSTEQNSNNDESKRRMDVQMSTGSF